MSQEGMKQNMEQGRGIVDKSPFTVVGIDKQDRDTNGQQLHDEPKRGRGRPPIQDNPFNTVGPDASKEQG